jgi:hypothetical protein
MQYCCYKTVSTGVIIKINLCTIILHLKIVVADRNFANANRLMLLQDGVGESLEQWRMRKEEEPLILQQFLRKSFICTFYTYKLFLTESH